MFDFHLHLARISSPTEAGAALLQEGCGFNSIACEPWEWELNLKLMENLKGKGCGVSHEQYASTRWFFGIHPMIATRVNEKDWRRLEEILRNGPDVQVGECGLDKRFEGYEEGGLQEQVLRRQLELAAELSREVQIHCVGDYHRVLREILPLRGPATLRNKFLSVLQPGQARDDNKTARDDTRSGSITRVVFHRFGGDISVVKSAIKLLGERAIFSLHADSFRKKSTAEAIREIPHSQVRFETDGDDESWTTERIISKLRRFQQARDSLAESLQPEP
ncbi:MAG: TatD family hydrolase [Fibrobacter sp.]|nr:TatD family hydrolase [Fibrobacter sp.]